MQNIITYYVHMIVSYKTKIAMMEKIHFFFDSQQHYLCAIGTTQSFR